MPEQSERAAAPSTDQGRRRIDLSLAQVTASALAAVVGAVLASELGVYGTIIGAAVVSIGATTGGALFQHLFRRTGEQLREAADRGPGRTVNGLQQVPLTETAPLPSAWRSEGGPADGDRAEHDRAVAGGWNDSGVFRARRRRSWKTYAALSALVFVLAMTPILIVEQATGKTVHDITTGQDGGGNSLFPGGGGRSGDRAPVKPGAGDPAAPSRAAETGSGATSGSGGAGASPSPSGSGGAGASATPSAPATPSGSPSPTPQGSSSPSPSGGSTSSSGASPQTGAATPPASTRPLPPAATPPAATPADAPTGQPGAAATP
ncbi:hypothetical protein [Kitasatospora sp. NBC_01302]|uniref:hypothetical protein n=1 Tax=Kitasatospora sp. NBC_01302 TaxID=2903575 RepID=UPI002E1408DF|nr:hypothetical protein OG294_14730 [Kitasatospora sp. NBC_01302]